MNLSKHLLPFAAACALALAGCAADQPAAAPQQQQVAKTDKAQQAQDQNEDVSCQTDTETGSRLHTRTVCTSDQDRNSAEQAMGVLRSHGGGTSH